jgi:hypothetical protein
MEHGGVVLWYRTDDQAIIDELEALVAGRLRQGDLIVMMPSSELPDDTIALSSWARRDVFPVAAYSAARVNAYLDAHERRFNPEGL